MKVCAEPGCPNIQPESRCIEHRRQRERARGTRQARGYDARYQTQRQATQRQMDAGARYVCWRCEAKGRPHIVDPNDWHQGHCDDDRSVIHGPECPAGNTGARGACPHPSHN